MTWLRRFLVLFTLMFWQGGFLFYSAVVVPTGTRVLGSAHDQGFITRQVTVAINLAGIVALLPMAWDLMIATDHAVRRRLRWLCWIILAITLVVLFWLHGWLDGLLEPEAQHILDRARFRTGHRIYLWVITVQWMAATLYLGLLIAGWRAEDQGLEKTRNNKVAREREARGLAHDAESV